jgi:ATP-dependent Clp protease ATP-binding subunit ClpA
MLSSNLEKRLNEAADFAKSNGHEFVSLEHILRFLLNDAEAIEILAHCGASIDEMKTKLDKFIDENCPMIDETAEEYSEDWKPEFTLACHRLLQRAVIQVQSAGRDMVSIGHILVALFDERESHAVFFLEEQGVNQFDIINFISHGVKRLQHSVQSRPGEEPDESSGAMGKSALESYCINLNEKAIEGKTDPLIGRDEVIERMVQVLCRRTKNNPLLIGEPGVGKTAIADGLAQRIVDREVPERLFNAEIYALDMGLVLAGTKFRGDFEERLKAILAEIKERENGIIFIDEIHTLIGAGATSGGSMDASNLLKPGLASGELSCIGSTTYKEFRQYFEKDRALTRRFQKIDIKEPNQQEAIDILKGLKTRYEKFHNVRYSDQALEKAVELSARYIPARFLPDKAIDVMDEVGAQASINNTGNEEPAKIELKDIEKVISSIAQVPTQSVSSNDKDRLRQLSFSLKSLIFGQDKAIDALAASIKASRSGLGRDDKPIGSFLFAGPTGVGKTEVTKQLAQYLGNKLVRFDMSEYMEKHAVSRLVGAPPGYVGYEEGGLLTEEVVKNPYSVVLLDEIEKAHPDLINILLQVLDNGSLTDPHGKVADFRNTIIIMTTNAGAREAAKSGIGINPPSPEGISDEAIKRVFAPEFINRLDSIIHFAPLTEDVVLRVVDKFILELGSQLGKQKVEIGVSERARNWLVEKGYDPVYGARPMARAIDKHLKTPLIDEILFGKLEKGGKVSVDLIKGELKFKYESTKEKKEEAKVK